MANISRSPNGDLMDSIHDKQSDRSKARDHGAGIFSGMASIRTAISVRQNRLVRDGAVELRRSERRPGSCGGSEGDSGSAACSTRNAASSICFGQPD